MANRIYDGVVPEPPPEVKRSVSPSHASFPEHGVPEAGVSAAEESSSDEGRRVPDSGGSSNTGGRIAALKEGVASRSVRFHEGQHLL